MTVSAAPLAHPVLRRAWFWVVLLGVVVLGAVLVAAISGPNRPALDPDSAEPDGSRALVHVLGHFGAHVETTGSLRAATAPGRAAGVVVTAPDAYSTAQLRVLIATAGRVVLIQPDTRTITALDASLTITPGRDPNEHPDCAVRAAAAAGPIAVPDDGLTYGDARFVATTCYNGLVLVDQRLVVLGSAQVLENGNLAGRGVAALAVNLITNDRTLSRVEWLSPGSDADGPGAASVWDLFPGGAHRVFFWLLVIGVLLVLWRGRRLGAVVTEPLPVVVRAAELVEGHGRLYRRAGARDHAAAALRRATLRRLAARMSLPRGASPEQVTAAVAPLVDRSPAHVFTLLAGPVPADDATLVRLATELNRLETAVTEGTTR